MKARIFKILGVTIALSFAFAAINPDIRKKVTSLVQKNERIILAIANAPLDDTKEAFQILKVRTKDGLFIEVYGTENKNGVVSNKLLASAKLPDKKDGYFTFNGQVTNLAVDNVDNDDNKEILATSFDDNMVAHLNIFRYVKGQNRLQVVELN